MTVQRTNINLQKQLVSGVKKRQRTLTLITQRALPGAPLEALNNAVFDGAEQRLVHLQGKMHHELETKTGNL